MQYGRSRSRWKKVGLSVAGVAAAGGLVAGGVAASSNDDALPASGTTRSGSALRATVTPYGSAQNLQVAIAGKISANHPDEVFVQIDQQAGEVVVQANPMCGATTASCPPQVPIKERLEVVQKKPGALELIFKPTSDGAMKGSLRLEQRPGHDVQVVNGLQDAASVAVFTVGRNTEPSVVYEKTDQRFKRQLAPQTPGSGATLDGQAIELASSVDDHGLNIDCGWVTCSAYVPRGTTQQLAGLVSSNRGSFWPLSGAGAACSALVAALGPLGGAICLAGGWQVAELQDAINDAVRTHGCVRLRTTKDTKFPYLLKSYSDNGSHCLD